MTIVIFLRSISFLSAQPAREQTSSQDMSIAREDYSVSSKRYITDEEGNIMMWVNVWGHVKSPGHHLVYDGIDLATLMSVTGGPQFGANLKKIKLFREVPDNKGKLQYTIDLDTFLESGDRSSFVKVLPNDTYIIPQKTSAVIWSQVGTVSTLLGFINLYYQILNYRGRSR